MKNFAGKSPQKNSKKISISQNFKKSKKTWTTHMHTAEYNPLAAYVAKAKIQNIAWKIWNHTVAYISP